MDSKIIDFTEQVNKRNEAKNMKSYETNISEAYAEEVAEEFKNMLNEETKTKKPERRR